MAQKQAHSSRTEVSLFTRCLTSWSSLLHLHRSPSKTNAVRPSLPDTEANDRPQSIAADVQEVREDLTATQEGSIVVQQQQEPEVSNVGQIEHTEDEGDKDARSAANVADAREAGQPGLSEGILPTQTTETDQKVQLHTEMAGRENPLVATTAGSEMPPVSPPTSNDMLQNFNAFVMQNIRVMELRVKNEELRKAYHDLLQELKKQIAALQQVGGSGAIDAELKNSQARTAPSLLQTMERLERAGDDFGRSAEDLIKNEWSLKEMSPRLSIGEAESTFRLLEKAGVEWPSGSTSLGGTESAGVAEVLQDPIEPKNQLLELQKKIDYVEQQMLEIRIANSSVSPDSLGEEQLSGNTFLDTLSHFSEEYRRLSEQRELLELEFIRSREDAAQESISLVKTTTDQHPPSSTVQADPDTQLDRGQEKEAPIDPEPVYAPLPARSEYVHSWLAGNSEQPDVSQSHFRTTPEWSVSSSMMAEKGDHARSMTSSPFQTYAPDRQARSPFPLSGIKNARGTPAAQQPKGPTT